MDPACGAESAKGRHWRLLATLPELHPTWLPYLGEGAA